MQVDFELLSCARLAAARWRVCPTPRTVRRVLLLSTVFAFATAVAAPPRVPSEHELRCMYCVEVIRAEILLQHHLISASDEAAISAPTPELRQQWLNTSAELLQGLAKLEVVLNRLQVYMLPRIRALDAYALATALREGDDDFEQSRAIADRCAVQCDPLHAMNEQLQACRASCSNDALLKKVRACENPTWLPPP